MFSDAPRQLFAADEVAPVAGRGEHEVLGDDPAEPQRPAARHVRRRVRVHAELEPEIRSAHQDHHTRVQRQRPRQSGQALGRRALGLGKSPRRDGNDIGTGRPRNDLFQKVKFTRCPLPYVPVVMNESY